MQNLEKDLQNLIKRFEEMIKSFGNMHRADPNILSNIKITTLYGTQELKSLASIVGNSDGSRSLRITPFDSNNIKFISKALWDSQLGNVIENKNEIILSLHPVTQEYKEKIVKDLKVKSEQTKVAIRQLRQDFLNNIKTLKSEEEKKRKQNDVQKLIDKYIDNVDLLLNNFIKRG